VRVAVVVAVGVAMGVAMVIGFLRLLRSENFFATD